MSIRVSPAEAKPTHHISLEDRNGKRMGLTLVKADGSPRAFHEPGLYRKSPVTTTAFKQTSGSSGYDIFEYPYSPIVQDTLEGGRGNLDFERDSTKFYDSYRAATGRQNKAFAGPLEQYAEGAHRSIIQSMPGSVDWIQMTGTTRCIYKRFTATGMTTSNVWVKLRHKGKPGNLTIKIYSDGGAPQGVVTLNEELDSVTVSHTDKDDIMGEWLKKTMVETLTNGWRYWLVLIADEEDTDRKHWKVATAGGVGTTHASSELDLTPSAAPFDLYFRLTDADTDKSCIPFEYKEGQYFVVSGTSGAPKLYMAGDRGAADSNAGQLDKLLDATKSWTTDELVGSIVLITDGPGRLEPQPWRRITSNTGSAATMDTPFTIPHTTATEYVILSAKIKEITGHGLTAPVTDVLVSTTGVVYFCMGDSVTVRRLRAYNDAGAWRDFSDATNCQANETATTKAVFMVYKPQAQRIVIGNNSDVNGDVSVNINTNTSIPEWGTALTWAATPMKADSKYRRINGMIVHPDTNGDEVVWVMKSDMPYVAGGTTTISSFYPVGVDEMKNVKSNMNGVNPLKHDVYLYIPILQGLEKYYGGTYTDMGPNLGEGLPENRRGSIVDSVGYPGKFLVAIDAGAAGYSSLMDSGGWHERYRAPKGQRIKMVTFQVIPGTSVDRLWIYQGNDFVWLPFPSNTNELEDSEYSYVDEWAVQFSRMHAGMFDVQKMIKFLKIQSDRLERDANGRQVTWFELDFMKDGETEWTTFDDYISESPTHLMDFTNIYGLAGKQLNYRIRGYTRDKNKTAVFLAIIIFAVQRVDVKNFYGPFTVLCEDDEEIGLRERDGAYGALEKVELLEDWGDASNDSFLKVGCLSPLLDGKMMFINVNDIEQVRFRRRDGNEWTKDAYLVNVNFQDA